VRKNRGHDSNIFESPPRLDNRTRSELDMGPDRVFLCSVGQWVGSNRPGQSGPNCSACYTNQSELFRVSVSLTATDYFHFLVTDHAAVKSKQMVTVSAWGQRRCVLGEAGICNFPTEEIIRAQNLNCALNSPK